MSEQHHLCANAACSYLAHQDSARFGGFCCKWCHWSFENSRVPPEHGKQCCERRATVQAERALPISPSVPLSALRGKKKRKGKKKKTRHKEKGNAAAEEEAVAAHAAPIHRHRPRPPANSPPKEAPCRSDAQPDRLEMSGSRSERSAFRLKSSASCAPRPSGKLSVGDQAASIHRPRSGQGARCRPVAQPDCLERSACRSERSASRLERTASCARRPPAKLSIGDTVEFVQMKRRPCFNGKRGQITYMYHKDRGRGPAMFDVRFFDTDEQVWSVMRNIGSSFITLVAAGNP